MYRTIVITGGASGIGRATAALIQDRGHRVIRVDLRDADVIADLSQPEGRRAMIDGVSSIAPEGIDGIAAIAGVSDIANPRATMAVNFFGAVATMEGLLPLLLHSRSPRAMLVGSTAAFLPSDPELIEVCMSGNEDGAISLAARKADFAYNSSKNALLRWMRKAATSPQWAGAGILLNAIGPGSVRTPMIEKFIATEEGRALLSQYTPIALDRPYGEPEDIAEVIAFLLEMERSYLIGQILYVDGGTDAIMRPEQI